ncbi:unnamed protein product [Camellia sinensis]
MDESQTTLALVCGNSATNKRTSPKLLSLLSCCLIFARSDLSLLYSFGHEDASIVAEIDVNAPLCSSIPNACRILFRRSASTGFLSEVLMDSQNGGGESLIGTIKIAVLPITKIGFFTFTSMFDILSTRTSHHFRENDEWWFIPFNVVLATISGSLIGLLVASIVHPPYPFFKFTIIQIGIGLFSMVHAWVWAWQLLELLMKISMTTSEAVNFVRNQLRQHGDVQALGRAALDRRSQDNVSIIIVDLGRTNWQSLPRSERKFCL